MAAHRARRAAGPWPDLGQRKARGTVKPRGLPSCCDPAGLSDPRSRTDRAWTESFVPEVSNDLMLCALLLAAVCSHPGVASQSRT